MLPIIMMILMPKSIPTFLRAYSLLVVGCLVVVLCCVVVLLCVVVVLLIFTLLLV